MKIKPGLLNIWPFSKGQTKDTQDLLLASSPNGYSIGQYFKLIPKTARASIEHQTSYYNKHKGANTTLTMAFKCNLKMFQQDDVDEHTELVHGITSPNLLRALNTIEIDAKLPFHLEPALDIEQVGPDEQGKILDGWFTRCMGRGVVTKSSSKNNCDLNENRSTEFLKEVENSTSKTYYPKFQMKLRNKHKSRIHG